ncbi:MAG: 30S ribosomal protein S2, partial [Planctomycetota bacterium]
MSTGIDIKALIEAGVHFGHRASRWHPGMERYIYGTHNAIHIVDLRETVRGLIRASHFLTRVVEAGHEIVFVGTKPQAREVVRQQSTRCGMHYVVNRWLGGTLTNFDTIRSRLRRLEQLEAMETDGSINLRKKKEVSRLRRERRKIHRNLEGIRRMSKLPGAAIIVDVRRDDIAVAECKLLGIPVIAICDTDTDPAIPDLVIPGNDDAYRSIEVILTRLADAIMVGRDKLVARQEAEEKKR